jgi:hypothetical protein
MMLPWIAILGGLLLMMGQHSRSESLFYYFRLEDQISENHLLRLIDCHISFDFVRRKLKDSYSDTGRPSIRPGVAVAHASGRVSVRHHQRAQVSGRAAHAFSLALVHRVGLRAGDPAPLHPFQRTRSDCDACVCAGCGSREQFYLAATVQNLKRLVRFLSCRPTPEIATA